MYIRATSAEPGKSGWGIGSVQVEDRLCIHEVCFHVACAYGADHRNALC